MTNGALLTTTSRQATKERRASARLLREVAAQAEVERCQKEAAARLRRRQALLTHHRKAHRIELALQGISALCELGRSKQVQSLIATRGKPIRIFGGTEVVCPGGDMADVQWGYTSYLSLQTDRLVLHNYTSTGSLARKLTMDRFEGGYFLFDFLYATEDAFLWSRPLWRIATPKELNLDDVGDTSRGRLYDTHDVVILFQVLVNCADPKILGRIFRDAIR